MEEWNYGFANRHKLISSEKKPPTIKRTESHDVKTLEAKILVPFFLHPRTIVFLSFPIQFTCKHRTHKHTHRFYLFSQWDRFLMLLLVSTTDLFTCVFRAVRCCPNIYWCCSCFNCPFIRFCKPLLTVECWARSRFWLSIIVELNCPRRGNNKYCYCSNALLSSVSVDSVSLKWINEHHKLILHLYLMSFSLLYIPPIYFE